MPAIVGDLTRPLARDRLRSAQLGPLALELTRQDHELLDLIGRHPFLTAADIAVFVGCSQAHALRRRRRLIRLGLARVVEREEVRRAAERQLTDLGLVELTRAGLWLLAADHGLSLATAIRECGLSGGGMDDPIGQRKGLIACLEHTLGVNSVFADFARAARHKSAEGGDEALVEWRNAHACRDGYLYPDGFGLYRRSGQTFGFFVEYDRGTERVRDYEEKLRAYWYYLKSRLFMRRYEVFPTILFVVSDERSEERIARVVRVMSSRHSQTLPILLTAEQRLCDRGAQPSILGMVWREAASDDGSRRLWPAD